MIRRNCVAWGLLLVFLAWALPAAAETPGEKETLEHNTKALAAAIDRLATVLDKQAGQSEQEELYQKLNLAIAYLNFRSRRIESLEGDLQQTKTAKGQIERTLAVWVEQREEMERTAPTIKDETRQQRLSDIGIRINMVKERISHLDDEIVGLENKIYELQGQLDSVEEFVRKNLAL